MNLAEQLEKEILALNRNSSWLYEESISDEDLAFLLERLGRKREKQPPKNDSPSLKQSDFPKTKISDLPVNLATNLDSLRLRITGCQDCKLFLRRQNIVFGQGNPNAEIMFIGEAPGGGEDISGLAFVGKAGKLLSAIILSMGLNRKEVFISNAVKCRPPGNRNPEIDELEKCRPILDKQIELIDPKLIVAVGGIAAKSLLNSDTSVSRLRKKLHDFRNRKIAVIYHPSYLLRNPTAFAGMWEDVKWIRAEIPELLKKQ